MQTFNISSVFLPALFTALLRNKLESFVDSPVTDTYDYIIIGSGYGGSVVANRLSENPEHKVLLLEAGDKDNISTQIPLSTLPLTQSDYDWNYKIVPQKKACYGMIDNSCTVVAGKVLGGSSSFDSMFYIRGHREDFDNWEKLGNTGWSYKDVLPFFKKSENYRVEGDCVESEYHGCGGELFVGPLPKGTEMPQTVIFMQGGRELGWEEVDYDGAKQIGMSRIHFTMRNGIRQTAATAFLRPIMKRSNLHISLNSFVHKIIVDSKTKRATGVEFEKNGKIIQVQALKEIILSAGIYSSPKILMLSGIGQKKELEKFNIPVIVDLPGVGQNLIEKIASYVTFLTGEKISEERANILTVKTLKDWVNGTGILASSMGTDAIIFFRTEYAENKEAADILVFLESFPLTSLTTVFLKKSSRYTDEFWNKHFVHQINQETMVLHVTVLKPKSKGSVTIRSSNPQDHPVIDPNFYGDEQDKKVLISGIHLAARLRFTDAVKRNNFKILHESEDDCDALENTDPTKDPHISCMVKYGTLNRQFGCCTNKMGSDEDAMAVVDHRLRVRGVKGLRIADASVMPQQHSGLPAATTIMIGEKAAHMIKEDNA